MTAMSKSNIKILPLGAILQEFKFGDLNIVQNFPTEELYQKYNEPYFGETIGRVANRIAGAKITRLNGKSYTLAANNGPNSLHGGRVGWGKHHFDGPISVERSGKQSIQFRYLSAHGDEGFPGTVELFVYYTITTEHDGDNEIEILEAEYECELVGDEDIEETVVAVTNHSYWNLAGTSTIEGTIVTLSTNMHQPVDDTDIPIGDITPYPGIVSNKDFILGSAEPDIVCTLLSSLEA